MLCILCNVRCWVRVHLQVSILPFVLERFAISAVSSVNLFFNGYKTNVAMVENWLPQSCFRVCISTFVINQERNYICSKEKKSFTVAGQDETVPIHMAANLPVESNHYCQLNHFRLTWRQNRELSTPLPVRKRIFFPHFIGTMHIKMSHIDMPRECFMMYAVTAVWAFDK